MLLLQSAVESFQLSCPAFSSQWSSQNYVWEFLGFELLIFNDFFSKNFMFTIAAYGEIKNSIMYKTSDRRAKRSEIWDLWVVVQHI